MEQNPFKDTPDEQLLADEDLGKMIEVIRHDNGDIKIALRLYAEVNIPASVQQDHGDQSGAIAGVFHERMTLDMWEIASYIAAKIRATKK